MRLTIAVATFASMAGGVAAAGGLNMNRSDTVRDVVIDIVHDVALDCGGVGSGGSLDYVGSGSTNGESMMLGYPTAVQQIAVMSRSLKAFPGAPGDLPPSSEGACAPSAPQSEGVVFGL